MKRKTGTVEWFDSWGEIKSDKGELIWFSYYTLDPTNEQNPVAGDRVSFYRVADDYRRYDGTKTKWKYKAIMVKLI